MAPSVEVMMVDPILRSVTACPLVPGALLEVPELNPRKRESKAAKINRRVHFEIIEK